MLSSIMSAFLNTKRDVLRKPQNFHFDFTRSLLPKATGLGEAKEMSYANIMLNEVIYKCTQSFPQQCYALLLNLFVQTALSWHRPRGGCVSRFFFKLNK